MCVRRKNFLLEFFNLKLISKKLWFVAVFGFKTKIRIPYAGTKSSCLNLITSIYHCDIWPILNLFLPFFLRISNELLCYIHKNFIWLQQLLKQRSAGCLKFESQFKLRIKNKIQLETTLVYSERNPEMIFQTLATTILSLRAGT